LKDLPIHLPEESTWARHVYHLYVIRCDEKIRDELFSFLRSQGIEVSMHYPIPCHLQEALSHKKNIHLPLTEKYAKQIISLPMHPHLKQEELDFVIEKMHRFFR
jgi:dTDP-4-amino-4,6-dideoxygalactose transaminase